MGQEISFLNSKDLNFEPLNKTSNEFSKGDFKHFMIKEIHEQPLVIKNTQKYYDMDYFLDFRNKLKDVSKEVDSFVFVGCGTAYHACLIAKYYFEKYTDIDASCEYASELRYKKISSKKKSIYVFISQSGETKDTHRSLVTAQGMMIPTFSVVNQVKLAVIFILCSISESPEIWFVS